jgi:hypothetical protein
MHMDPLSQAATGAMGLRLACDTGGTFTDLVVEDGDHQAPVVNLPDRARSNARSMLVIL